MVVGVLGPFAVVATAFVDSFFAAPVKAVGDVAPLELVCALASTVVAVVFELFASPSTFGSSSSLRFLPCLRQGTKGVERTRFSLGNLCLAKENYFLSN